MRRQYSILLFLVSIALLSAGCDKAAGTSTTNSNEAATQAGPGAGPSPSIMSSEPPAILSGTYTVSEVQDGGIVTMISPENSTSIKFTPSEESSQMMGLFSRRSKSSGKTDHIDSGQFLAEGTDQLTLNIMTSKGQVVKEPVKKKYKYTLSPDSEELRLTTEDGKVAIFRRTKKLDEQ